MTKQRVIDNIHACQDVLSEGILAQMDKDSLIGLLSEIAKEVSRIDEPSDIDFDTIELAGYKRAIHTSAEWLKSNCYLDDEYLDRYIQAML